MSGQQSCWLGTLARPQVWVEQENLHSKGGMAMAITSRDRYDSKRGIASFLTDLASFNELVRLRSEAGYARHERLNDFYLFGRWSFDSCGNLGTIKEFVPKEHFPEIPDVLTKDEFWASLKHLGQEHLSITVSFDGSIPPVRVICAECGKPWNIRNCHDFVTRRNIVEMPLADFVGMSVKEVRDHLSARTDAVYSLSSDRPIRHDRFIDLRPRPGYETLKINEHGWAGKDEGITERYTVQDGDEGLVYVWKCFHKACVQKYLERLQREKFEKIFRDAGFVDFTLTAVPNLYCGDTTQYAPWFEVTTGFGVIVIGWRKRVIMIDWTATSVNAAVPGENDVTCGPRWSHAWGEEKATEYLRRIWQASQK